LAASKPIAHSTRPNPFYFRRAELDNENHLLWEVLVRHPENPERLGEPDDAAEAGSGLYSAGTVLVTIDGREIESFITGNPSLTDGEAEEIAAQAEIVVREAVLERGRIVDADGGTGAELEPRRRTA
jgi:hypothetical protein